MLLIPLFVTWLSPSAPTGEHENYQSYTKQNNQDESSRIVIVLDSIESLIERYEKTLIVIATIAIALYTRRLWSTTLDLFGATKDSADAAKAATETLPLIERAYVFANVRFDQSTPYLFGGRNFKYTVLFVNGGKTPAVITMLRGYGLVAEEPPEELIQRELAPLPDGLAIASGEAYPLPIRTHVTDVELRDINDLSKRLYCVGLIKYRDILGHDRETGFCWEYRKVPIEFGVNVGPVRMAEFVFCRNSKLNYTEENRPKNS